MSTYLCLPGLRVQTVFSTHTCRGLCRRARLLEYEYYALVPQERPMLGDDGPIAVVHAGAALHHGTRLMGTTHSPGHELSAAVGAG